MIAPSVAAGPRRFLPDWLARDLTRHEPILTRFAVLAALLMVPTLMAMSVEMRTYNGVNVWLKPFKFELSLLTYALTLTIFATYIDDRFRTTRGYRFWVTAFPIVTLFNFGYLIFRAARAEASHFNRETALAEVLYGAMGLGALMQMGVAILFGILILRSQERSIAPALRLSLGLGLTVGALLTIVCGGYLGAQESHWVGGLEDDGHGVPFFGWSRTGGDLRIAHFIGMHAMQGLPVIGLLAARLSEPRGKLLVWASTVLWIALTIAVLLQAIAGSPLFPL